MKNIGNIYKITSPTGRVYIGQTTNLIARIKVYEKLRCERQYKLYQSLKKYGWSSHILDVIETCTIKELSQREIYWINFYKSNCSTHPLVRGMNLTAGGEGSTGRVCLPETREKLSRATKGKIISESHKEILRELLRGNKRGSGQGMSIENKIKVAERNKHKVWSEESKAKISASLTGKKQSDETIENRVSKFRGKDHKLSKLVLDEFIGVYFDTIAEAATTYDISPKCLSRYLTGKRRNKTNLIYA